MRTTQARVRTPSLKRSEADVTSPKSASKPNAAAKDGGAKKQESKSSPSKPAEVARKPKGPKPGGDADIEAQILRLFMSKEHNYTLQEACDKLNYPKDAALTRRIGRAKALALAALAPAAQHAIFEH